MFKGVSRCILFFGSFNSSYYSALLPFPIFQQLTIHNLISSTSTGVIFYNIVDALTFFFAFTPSMSSHNITNMFYIWVCIWSCWGLCMCLSFGSVFYVWEKTCSLCLSETGLLHLTVCPLIVSIYLQTTYCHYSLWLCKIPLCIYTTFFWFIHQL
jgi:hypothetical protein